jgi:predicted tellurium resistance membrane protein TerC
MFDWLADPQAWLTLFTLSAIEIVLGIDNLVFISIAVSKLPHEKRERAANSASRWRASPASRCC